MTAKEKADELWWKYYNSIEHKLSEEYSPHEKHITKELVLIALNEILGHMGADRGYTFWQEVKQEIEKYD
jgi:hypothetical protein